LPRVSFLDRTSSSRWPCDIAGAKAVTIFLFTEDSTIPGRSTEIGQRSTGGAGSTTRETPYPLPPVNERSSIQATLEPLEVQNLGNKITELMDVTMRKGLKISVLIEFSTKNMSDEKLEQIKDLLKEISPKLQMD